ncbi:hypothetical protein FAK_36390 [Desulfoferula mesophila]|uniref:Uncharacterized protein n=1 Tax=Desulfoferula mesophila TaxID=3058419 RepID=A0AAU9F2J4_9BACT|nr:hypothetical protein FAK_36390 [Desulfoferula mesophilus]
MAVYPDTLDPKKLSDRQAVEAWRRTITIGDGSIVLLAAYHSVEHPEQGRQIEASITVTSFCCPRCIPVSSVVVWTEYGDEAIGKLQDMEKTVSFNP